MSSFSCLGSFTFLIKGINEYKVIKSIILKYELYVTIENDLFIKQVYCNCK